MLYGERVTTQVMHQRGYTTTTSPQWMGGACRRSVADRVVDGDVQMGIKSFNFILSVLYGYWRQSKWSTQGNSRSN